MADETGAPTATMEAAAAAAAAAPPVDEGKGRRKKKEKAPKPPKAERAPKPARAVPARSRNPNWDLSLSNEGPSRQQLEQEAASEFWAAVTPAYDLLKAEVPDAPSPEDAQRKIEGELGRVGTVSDKDAGIPRHPIYTGDALVYYQLRRHYGSPNAGGSFRRSWFPLQPR
jgi:hypothetical protein